jgi:hypothetical protein
VWAFHIDPPHDEEYGEWLFLSLFDTALPWIYCSVPFLLIVLSLDTGHRRRRTLMTVTWAVIIICIAWVKLRPVLHASPPPGFGTITSIRWMTLNVENFAINWLFPAFCVLATLLFLEKKLVNRGL